MTDSLPSNAEAEGSTAPGFEPVAEEFRRLLAAERDARGQFCGYLRGQRVVDLWGGDGIAADDLQGVYSSTKGVSAVCIALLVQRGALDLDAPVSRYWPEFAGGGKGDITVRVALSHQAGIPGVEPQLSHEEVLDHDTVAARLAAQVPHWRPGKAHGYHGLTIGTMMDELVRRVEGVPIAEFFRKEIGDPRDIRRLQHGAAADQGLVSEASGEAGDAVERIGRVERHLDDPDSGIDKRAADRLRLLGANAADDRDQRTLPEIAPEDLDRVHHNISVSTRIPARKAAAPSTTIVSRPATASAAP